MTEPLPAPDASLQAELEQSARELRQSRIFCKFSRQEIAQIVPLVVRKSLDQGEPLYKVGDRATHVFFVVSGAVGLQKDGRILDELLRDSYLGTESVVDVETYQVDAIAQAPTQLLLIPRDPVLKLLAAHPERKLDFYTALVGQLSTARGTRDLTTAHQVSEIQAVADERKREEQLKKSRFIGWSLALIMPLLIRFLSVEFWGMNDQQSLFMLVLTAAVVMWMFSLVPEFVAGVFAIMALLVMGVAPSSVTLSGFASGSYFMALSLFALGSILARSGLTFRLVLLISKYVPNKQFWYANSLLLNGLLLTPVLPSANGRVNILSKILVEMIDAVRLKHGGKAATYLATSTLMGASIFSFMFLSSKSANFIVFGLLPTHLQYQFSWAYWLFACLIALALMLVLFVAASALIFKNDEVPRITREQVRAQLRILGPVTATEWVALSCVLVFIVGTLTASVHKISLPWIGLGVLYLVLALGLMGKQDFKSRIDWSFLVLLGSLVGLSKAMAYLEMNDLIASRLSWLADFMTHQFDIFIVILFALVVLARLALPTTATVALFATILLPLADRTGVNPWLVGLLILNFSEVWFLPYQCSYYVLFRNSVPKGLYDEKKLQQVNLVTIAFRLIVVYASIWYWRNSLGLLSG